MSVVQWCRRTAVVVGTSLGAVLVPAVAWAHTNPTAVAVGEVLDRRRRTGRVSGGGIGGVLGVLGILCCLLVVAAIVLGVVLILRRRK